MAEEGVKLVLNLRLSPETEELIKAKLKERAVCIQRADEEATGVFGLVACCNG